MASLREAFHVKSNLLLGAYSSLPTQSARYLSISRHLDASILLYS